MEDKNRTSIIDNRIDDEKTALTGDKKLHGTLLRSSSPVDDRVPFTYPAPNVCVEDDNNSPNVLLKTRTRAGEAFRDFGTRVITILESKPILCVNIVVLVVAFIFFMTATASVVPVTIEKFHLTDSLNETETMLLNCIESYNVTSKTLVSCNENYDKSKAQIVVNDKEIEKLKDSLATLTATFAAKQREVIDLTKRLEAKANQSGSCPPWYDWFSSSAAGVSPLNFLVLLFIVSAMTHLFS